MSSASKPTIKPSDSEGEIEGVGDEVLLATAEQMEALAAKLETVERKLDAVLEGLGAAFGPKSSAGGPTMKKARTEVQE